jgi:hypothetical protein
MPSSDVNVIFIGGASRTGSTLLSLLLGSLRGHLAAGEMRYVWLRGLRGNQLCGCGEPFRSCPFWRQVMTTALGPIDEIDAERYAGLWHEVATPQAVLRSRGRTSDAHADRRHEYLDAMRRVFLAIDRVTGGQVIVDSSKYATDCLLLSRLPGIRVHAIHLVRDSRAVAHSWQRKKHRPEIYWRQQDMSRFSPWRTSFDWGLMNAAMEAVGRKVDRYDRIRYEDLVCDPVGTLEDVLPGEVMASVAEVLSGRHAGGATSHTVSGNPLRFQSGPLTIRPDVEWVSKMDPGDRRLVTALTWPMLMRYGYSLTLRETMV